MLYRPRSILSKLLALFLVAAVVPLGLLGIYFFYNSMRATQEMVGNRTARLAELSRAELENKLQLRLQDRLLTVNEPLQQYLRGLRESDRRGDVARARELRAYLSELFVQSGEFYEDLVVADGAGRPLLRHDRLTPAGATGSRPPGLLRQPLLPAPPAPVGPTPPPSAFPPGGFPGAPLEIREEDVGAFQDAASLADGDIRLRVEPAAPGHAPAAVLLMPVQANDAPELRLGYLAARLRASYLWPGDWENRRFGERGELMVADPTSGQVLYHSTAGRAGRPLAQVDPELLDAVAPAAPQGPDRPAWRTIPGPAGGRVATPLPVSGTPWVVVATAAPGEFASEARRAAALNLLVGTLALVIAMSLIGLVGRRMSRSIQVLTSRAQRVAEGDLAGPEIEAETHDEVQTLSEAFNVMTRSLRRSTELRDRAVAELDALNRSLETRVRDRTRQLEELNAALNRANEELKELDRLKSNFLATVSHEFKTPLTSIKAFAEILHDELAAQDAPADMRRFLQIIDSESDRLARLIQNILDLSRIEAGRMVWRMAEVPARTVIEATLDGLLPALKEKRIRVERDLTVADAVLYGDADRLQEVFTNVLDNAIRASAPGQSIAIRCAEAPAPANGAARMLHFSITDQGHGIPTDQLERIFDRFHQVSPDGRRRKGGTGLGLAICREITEHHGGRIWAEGRAAGGSTFHITLPRAGYAPAPQAPARPAGPPERTAPGGTAHG